MTRMLPFLKLLTVFLVAFSLASLSGPMSSNFHLPSIQPAHAIVPLCVAVQCGHCDVMIGSYCNGYWVPGGASEDTFQATIFTDEASEFTNIQSATPNIDFTDWPLTPNLVSTFTASPNFQITSSISEAGYYEIQFMLAANFWGCSMNFGNSTCGINIRQGIAHMIDTAKFAAGEPSIAGQAVALDSPNPSDNVGGLPAVNPCTWDSMFPENYSNCSTPPAGGLAYHLGTAAGAGGFVWNQAPGSADLDAAAAHFVAAGLATGCDGGTGTVSCISSTDSRLSGISSAALSNPVNFFREQGNVARLDLGNSVAGQICYMFTGSNTVPCGYLTRACGLCTQFPGVFTSTTGVNPSWGMYMAAYQSPVGPTPFDHSLYFQYNSRFVSGVPSIQPPNGPCSSSAVPTANAPDYMYLCDPVYDSLTNSIESASSISSAINFGEQAEERFGAHAYTIPIFEQNSQFGYLNNGWIRADNNAGSGLPNYFTWLNAWNPTPALPGTLRQGFKQTTSSVSPFVVNSQWDAYIVGNIYDSLAVTNPTSGGQLIYWMALSVNQLPNSGLTYTPPAGTSQTFRFTLRSDMFFQDGRKVTSFDVAFSYLALKGTGAFAGGGAAPMTGVTILSPSQLDINLGAFGPFTLLSLTTVPILPGAYWTNAGSSAWNNAIMSCATTNAPCYPAQYTINSANPTTTSCALNCTFPTTLMNVNTAQIGAAYDPIANHTLVGSGPWECGTVTSSGSSTSCSSSGTENPPVGGSYTLTRFGKGLPPASSISGSYFRSNGSLALYLWSQDTGDGTHDFLNFSVVASCFGAPVASTGPCAHFQQGIGANGGPVSVGLAQVAIVNRFVGNNWVAPFNWNNSPPTGIIPLNPILYENTLTLDPASVAGCATPYPAGGYDC